jgi:hypothetical protein
VRIKLWAFAEPKIERIGSPAVSTIGAWPGRTTLFAAEHSLKTVNHMFHAGYFLADAHRLS